MLGVNDFDQHVAARMFDFFAEHTPWQRRLWRVSVLTVMDELLEAGEVLQHGVLSDQAVAFLADEFLELAKSDPAFLPYIHTLGQAVDAKRRNGFRPGSQSREILVQVRDKVAATYLTAWRSALVGGQIKAERAARALATFLLRRGHHPTHLHRWLAYQVRRRTDLLDLKDLILEADALAGIPDKEFEVLVGFSVAPRQGFAPQLAWKSDQDVADWLRSAGHRPQKLRAGLVMKVSAQDVHSAVEMIAERLEQMESRLRVGSGESLRHHPDVFVADRKASVLPLAINRGLEVGSLDRAGKIFDGAASGPLDSALHLASSLAHAPAPMAVAGGWSAVESLLSFPGDGEKVAAADRLSALVACSFPRAELTTLAHQYSACHTDALADSIRRVASNREKARCLLEGITSNAALPFPEQSDRAAVDRVRRLAANRPEALLDVERHAKFAVRRLYRLRNLVLHGGRVDAVALKLGLRIAAPLVGAGLDRVAHAHYVGGARPVELAARARLALDLGSDNLVGMLEA
jgi:hypothetical protein